MDLTSIFALAFAPGLFWLWYFYKKDRVEPEPLHLIFKTYFWGMAAVIPSIVFELPFKGLVLIVIAAPIIEEIFKFLAVRQTIYKHAEFDEPMDGIVYASAAALGFASAENVLYLLRAGASPAAFDSVTPVSAVISTAGLRAVLSVPGHVIFSLMWGEALGIAKFAPPERRRAIVVSGVLLAIALHAVFNAMVSFVPLFSVITFVVVSALWKTAHRRIEAALADSPHK